MTTTGGGSTNVLGGSLAQDELAILRHSQPVNRSAMQDVQLDRPLQQLLAGDDTGGRRGERMG